MVKYKFDDIAINSILKKKPTEEDKYTYIGLEHLDPGSLKVVRYGSEVAPKGEKLLMKKGDVLFGKRRAYQKKVGIAPFDGIFSAHGMVLRPKENVIDKDFFPLFISSDYFFDAAIKISVGSLSPTINWKDLKELEFELPSMEKQRELAQILWAAEKSKQSYKSLLQKTDDLVKAKFEEMFGDINLSRETEGKRLAEIVAIRDDLRKPLNDAERADMKSGILYPYYGAIGCVDYINDYRIDCKAICIAEDCGKYMAGDDSSYIISGKAWVNNHAHILIPDERICLIDFLNFYFKIMDLTKFISGSTREKLTRKVLEDLPIYLPNIAQQLKFVEFSKQAELSKQKLQKSLEQLNATTKALINENLK